MRFPARSNARIRVIALLLLGAAGVDPPRADAADEAGRIGYNRDVRPILSDRCFFCHGPDKAKRKAGLRLDVRDAAIEDKAIVAGKPDESELIRRITARSPDDVMPPPDSHKTLTAEQIALLRRWIEEGAAYEPHWFYVPVARPSVPPAVNHPIDAFVRATLAARGLGPSPEADRRTLLRRLSLDLTGLPPTAAEIDAFERDTRPDAYQRQVDRLLASPAYGERMAVPWLDVVRFADTVGYHGDQNVHVFPYRDWVIDAFNRNERFDRFTVAQLAGDLLPNRTTADVVASGFNRLNMITREGGAQAKEYLAKYAADRVRTVSAAWMGSTLGCAECHDHKYDPFTMVDFYSMAAFFADIKQWGVYHDYVYTPNPDLRGWSNEAPFPPELTVKSPYLARRARELRGEAERRLSEHTARIGGDASSRAALAAWRKQALAALGAHPDGWRVLLPTSCDVAAPGASKWDSPVAGVVSPAGIVRPTQRPPYKQRIDDAPAEFVQFTVDAAPGPLGSLRLEVLPDAEQGKPPRVVREPAPWARVKLSVSIVRAGVADSIKVRFAHADAPDRLPTWVNGHPVTGVEQALWRFLPSGDEPRTAVYQVEPVELRAGDKLRVRISFDDASAFRVAVSPLPRFGLLGAKRATARRAPFQLDLPRALASEGAALVDAFVASGGAGDEARAEVVRAIKEILGTRGGLAETVVTEAWQPRPVRVLARGNWQDESGPIALPAVPHFLPPLPPGPSRRTRLDLARWLVDEKNPLPARVTMNRLWKQFFGTGLSSSLGDLGAQGELPSHPELLDWMASELVRRGWDMKAMVRLIVTSDTYRQRSAVRADARELDPDNRLLARQNARRLDAEFVRDNALAVAGLLDRSIGGPSVFPHQPDGHWDNLNFPVRTYVASTGSEQHRRGLYVHWQRTFLHPMLTNFDAPSREECTADRLPSNSPQQALTLLNDPTFFEAARVFAARLVQTPDDDDTRLERAMRAALGRSPTATERATLLGLLAAERAHFRGRAEEAVRVVAGASRPGNEASELAAWTSVARVLFNLHEFITRT